MFSQIYCGYTPRCFVPGRSPSAQAKDDPVLPTWVTAHSTLFPWCVAPEQMIVFKTTTHWPALVRLWVSNLILIRLISNGFILCLNMLAGFWLSKDMNNFVTFSSRSFARQVFYISCVLFFNIFFSFVIYLRHSVAVCLDVMTCTYVF